MLPNSGYRVSTAQIAAALSEPGTWGMMLRGFAMIGSRLRRRSAKAGYAA